MGTNLDIASLLEGYNTAFMEKFQDQFNRPLPGEYAGYTEQIDAQGAKIVDYAFLANMPLMRAWTGGRQYKSLRGYSSTITYTPYESSLILKRNDVVLDKSGIVGRALSQHAGSAADFFDQVVSTAYDGSSGAGPTGYDAVALFSTAHPHADSSGNTQSNLASGTSLSHANLVAAEYAAALYTEENGRNFQINHNELRVGPKLKRRAMELVGPDRIVIVNQAGSLDTGISGANNVNAAAARSSANSGAYTVVVDRRVTNFYWTLRDTTRGNPMLLFVVRAPEVINRTEMTDQERWEHDNFLFGIEAEVGTGAGFWPAVYRGTGTD